MKFLKGLLITLIALFAVYVLLSFFLPSNTHVERNVEINAPAGTVWSKISVFKNWEAWSPWIENDSSINNVYTGTDGDLGSKMSWTSDSSGVGFMEILESVPNEKLVAILAFTEPWESSSEDTFILTEKDGKTTVSWSDHMEINFWARPIMFAMGMNTDKMDEMMGPDFEKGLANIKKLSEGVSKPLKIIEAELPESIYLGIRHKTTISEVMKSDFYATNFGKIMGALAGNENKITGPPVAIYYSFNEEDSTIEIVPAFPVSDASLSFDGMEVITMPKGKVVKAAFYGPYNESASVHYALDDYTKEKGLKTGLVVEEYANDPTTVSSPDEILTNIYYYIVD
ncbi:SRPBCC family protein [Flavobacteriales bacterium]|nr:SRPBCC family protein [Flavobacteriales bacterium]